MNIYKSLNEIIEYIENNLEEEIDYAKLAQMLGANEYTLQRIFTLICDISISDYVRKRRLSNAGFDIYHSDEKIVDIAVKYGYNNATSFSRAFEKFHGIKPSEVRGNSSALKIYPRLQFEEKDTSNADIEYSIIQKDEFVLYGVGIATQIGDISSDAPNFFNKTQEKYDKLYGEPDYGIIMYEERFESCNLEYWVAYAKEISEFEKIEFPKSKWICICIPSQDAKVIQDTSHKFYEQFVPSAKYNLKPLPELEYYHDNITEFLIPIED